MTANVIKTLLYRFRICSFREILIDKCQPFIFLFKFAEYVKAYNIVAFFCKLLYKGDAGIDASAGYQCCGG